LLIKKKTPEYGIFASSKNKNLRHFPMHNVNPNEAKVQAALYKDFGIYRIMRELD
jgi:hypothetical protein